MFCHVEQIATQLQITWMRILLNGISACDPRILEEIKWKIKALKFMSCWGGCGGVIVWYKIWKNCFSQTSSPPQVFFEWFAVMEVAVGFAENVVWMTYKEAARCSGSKMIRANKDVPSCFSVVVSFLLHQQFVFIISFGSMCVDCGKMKYSTIFFVKTPHVNILETIYYFKKGQVQCITWYKWSFF